MLFVYVNKKIERNELIMFKIFGQMQRIGKALMLPVAILPAAGLLLAIGTAFQGEALQHYLPFIKMILFNKSLICLQVLVVLYLIIYLLSLL